MAFRARHKRVAARDKPDDGPPKAKSKRVGPNAWLGCQSRVFFRNTSPERRGTGGKSLRAKLCLEPGDSPFPVIPGGDGVSTNKSPDGDGLRKQKPGNP